MCARTSIPTHIRKMMMDHSSNRDIHAKWARTQIHACLDGSGSDTYKERILQMNRDRNYRNSQTKIGHQVFAVREYK